MGMLSLPGFLSCGKKKDFSLSNEKDAHAGDSDENLERGNWSNKGDYLLSMVGYAVGLGNVWRFPYLTYQNGGGAFLIPYTLMLALAGLPLFFMECSLGQFASLGPISVWRILPLFQGWYSSLCIVYTFFRSYCAKSIHLILKLGLLQNCDFFSHMVSISLMFLGFLGIDPSHGLFSCHQNFMLKGRIVCCCHPLLIAAFCVFSKVALQRSSGLDETGNIVWYLALCLLLSWMIVGAALFKGIKSSGKVVYFTALFPYVILLILLVRGATLEGALDGIEYYIGRQSNITKLMEAEVWKDAATQIFYSLSVAWGGLVALSSYNKFHNNCYSDAILVCVTNCVTSVFAGFAIFSILGHMAFVSERPVSEVVDSGFDLAFVAYPEALSRLPVSPLWSFLFFFMLLLLGLDSQFATIETLTTTIQDIYPKVMKKLRIPVTLGVCILLFFLGLICVTQAGIYWVNLIDHFCAGWGILIAAVLEIIGIIYIYGGNRFIEDIEMMIGKKSRLFWLWWRMCWFFITPVLLM
ncbi:S6A14 protein, partial [Circaetus pectoralis]|nr:S6A14 protein [Circaetus pectoralis]